MGSASGQRSLVTRSYIPNTGDMIWLTFDPQAGREQAGRRPALVLSPAKYAHSCSPGMRCPEVWIPQEL
jgi:mRNA interferase MazF